MDFLKPLSAPRILRACALAAALALPCAAIAAAPPDPGSGAENDAALLARLQQYRSELEALKLQTNAQLEILRQRQDELAKLRAQLAQTVAVPAAVPVTVPVTVPAAAPAMPQAAVPPPAPLTAPKASPPPASAAKHTEPAAHPVAHPAVQEEMPDWQLGLLAAALLALVALLVRTGMRYARGKKQSRAKDDPPLIRLARGKTASTPVLLPKPVPSAPPPVAPPSSAPAASAPAKPAPAKEEWYEEASLLEEAQLYVSHGRMNQALEILQEINRHNPKNAEAWALLLSIYSSLGRIAEFEESAEAFHKNHKDSFLWGSIQALGRTLNPNNPLYTTSQTASALRRPIGDILLELGALSADTLRNWLEKFDPKTDGRLGGFLVKRRAITLSQLDKALLVQQGGDKTPLAPPPSLDELEKFMAGFDPKIHGTMSKYLASRHALSPEQINTLLQQQANQQAFS